PTQAMHLSRPRRSMPSPVFCWSRVSIMRLLGKEWLLERFGPASPTHTSTLGRLFPPGALFFPTRRDGHASASQNGSCGAVPVVARRASVSVDLARIAPWGILPALPNSSPRLARWQAASLLHGRYPGHSEIACLDGGERRVPGDRAGRNGN